MVDSCHMKTFTILKLNVMSKLNIKLLQCKQNTWEGSYKILKLVKFDDNFLPVEHLDNIDNDNEGYDGVDGSSSDNEEIKRTNSCHRKILLFAFYSNQCMATTKIIIRCDTNHLNSMYIPVQ